MKKVDAESLRPPPKFQVNIKIQLYTARLFRLSFRFLWLCWKEIYLLSGKVSLDCYVRSFQYKTLNNILYLNEKVFIFGKSSSPQCPFCKNDDETILHLFHECDITKALSKILISLFGKSLNLRFLSPQIAFLWFTNIYCNDVLLKNHILFLCNSRKHEKIWLNNLIRNATKVKNIEKEIAGNNEKKVMLYNKRWKKIENKSSEKRLINLSKVVVGGGAGGGGETVLLRNIFCFLLLFFYLSFVFSLFFVCVCVIIFCGSLVFLFWFYLIKSEINITKKEKKLRKKSKFRQFTWSVATESIQKQFLTVSDFCCFCQHFAIVGIFAAFFVKIGFRDFMDL